MRRTHIPKKSIALLVLSSLSLVSCGSGSTSTSLAVTASSLFHSWRYVGNDGGIQKEQHLRFESATLTNTIICRFPDGSAPQVVVSSPIQLTAANQFRIMESRQASQPGSMANCDASLTAGDYSYSIGPAQSYNGYYSGAVAGTTRLTLTALSGSSGSYSFDAE